MCACAILPVISPRAQSRSMQFKRANCYILPRNDLLARKRQAELFPFFSTLFFFFAIKTPAQRRVMKIRCGKRCGGRRSIIAVKFQPFASETLARLDVLLITLFVVITKLRLVGTAILH